MNIDWLLLGLLRVFSFLYDVITLPVYFFFQQPWVVWEEMRRKKAAHEIPGDPYSPLFRSDEDLPDEPMKSTPEVFDAVVKKYKNKKLFGTRKVISEEINEKGFKKVELGDPTWITYGEAHDKVHILSKALLRIGAKPKQPINILSETRYEWFMTALACNYINIPVATLYATLGIDGIIHGLNETEVEIIFTSSDLFPKVKNAILKAPKVKYIIYFESLNKPDVSMLSSDIKVMSFSEMMEIGASDTNDVVFPPRPDENDRVIIMYTSGSTGVPKAVEIKHGVIGYMVKEYSQLGLMKSDESMHVAYLPLAHLYELGMECLMIWLGFRIGYSSALTLTSQSPGLKAGCKGDVEIYKPTFIATVPLVLDRLRKGIMATVESKGPVAKLLFNYIVDYKIWWYRLGFDTPLLNQLVFKKTRDILGGRAQDLICAGAPLSADTEEFIKATLCVNICQGYGMTETCASGTCSLLNNRECGNVGPPNRFACIKLIDWVEGGYRATDKPNPRGEVLIGGKGIKSQYFKRDELNKEVFQDIDGIRYCYTGDIGEILPDGCLKIIDRKKDLVKLMFGEYISLGKVESAFLSAPLVDNICIYGHGLAKFLVAMISPNKAQLNRIAKSLHKEDLSFEKLCENEAILAACLKELKEFGLKCKLLRNEIPQKIKLYSEPWTPSNGLVTAAFKIKRRAIQDAFQSDIDAMYKE